MVQLYLRFLERTIHVSDTIKFQVGQTIKNVKNDIEGKVVAADIPTSKFGAATLLEISDAEFDGVIVCIPESEATDWIVRPVRPGEVWTIDKLMVRAHDHAVEAGFYDKWPDNPTQIALMHSELSEMLEADRNDDRKNYEEECADLFIRLLDHCAKLGIDLLDATLKKMDYNETRPRMHGGKAY